MKDNMKFEHECDGHKVSIELQEGYSIGTVFEKFKDFLIVCGYSEKTINEHTLEWAEEINSDGRED